MTKRRASMREGPLADLFRQTDGRAKAEDAPSRPQPVAPVAPPPRPDRRAEPAAQRAARSRLRAGVPSRADPGARRAAEHRTPRPVARCAPRRRRPRYLAVIRVVGVGGAGAERGRSG